MSLCALKLYWSVKRSALALAALAAFGVGAAEERVLLEQLPERAMPGLEALIESALAESEEAKLLELARSEAEGGLMVSRSAKRPQVRAYVNARREEYIGEALAESSKDVVIYQVAASQPVYHWGARQAEREMGELAHEIASLNAAEVEGRIAANARAAYMAAVVAKQVLALTDFRMEQKRRELAFQREKAAAGQLAALALEDSELEMERLELIRLRDEGEWRSRLLELGQIVGLEMTALEGRIGPLVPSVEPISAEGLAALEERFAAGLSGHGELLKKDASIEIARKALEIERQSLKPKVDAQVGVSQNGLDENGVRRQLQFAFVGVAVNWSLFDGFRSKGRRLEALARLERAERSRPQLEDALRLRGARAVARLDVAARTLRIEERLFARREEARATADRDLEAGAVSEAQHEEARRIYLESLIGIQRVRAEYFNAVVALAQLLDLDPWAEETSR